MTRTINPTKPVSDRQIVESINNFVSEDNNDIAIPNGFSSAFIGLSYNGATEPYHAVYSKQRMVTALMTEDKMSYEEAIEFLDFNTWNAYPPEGSHPLYIDEIDYI